MYVTNNYVYRFALLLFFFLTKGFMFKDSYLYSFSLQIRVPSEYKVISRFKLVKLC